MRVLVTGGAGFIGSQFVRRLAGQGESIAVLDKLTYAGNRANLEGVEHDEILEGDGVDRGQISQREARVTADLGGGAGGEAGGGVDGRTEGPAAQARVHLLADGGMHVAHMAPFVMHCPRGAAVRETYDTVACAP